MSYIILYIRFEVTLRRRQTFMVYTPVRDSGKPVANNLKFLPA